MASKGSKILIAVLVVTLIYLLGLVVFTSPDFQAKVQKQIDGEAVAPSSERTLSDEEVARIGESVDMGLLAKKVAGSIDIGDVAREVGAAIETSIPQQSEGQVVEAAKSAILASPELDARIAGAVEERAKADDGQLEGKVRKFVLESPEIETQITGAVEAQAQSADDLFNQMIAEGLVPEIIKSVLESDPDTLNSCINGWMETNREGLLDSLASRFSGSGSAKASVDALVKDTVLNSPEIEAQITGAVDAQTASIEALLSEMLGSDLAQEAIRSVLESDSTIFTAFANDWIEAHKDELPAMVAGSEAVKAQMAEAAKQAVLDSPEIQTQIADAVDAKAKTAGEQLGGMVPTLVSAVLAEHPEMLTGWIDAHKDEVAPEMAKAVLDSDGFEAQIDKAVATQTENAGDLFSQMLADEMVPTLMSAVLAENPEILTGWLDDHKDEVLAKLASEKEKEQQEKVARDVLGSADLKALLASAVADQRQEVVDGVLDSSQLEDQINKAVSTQTQDAAQLLCEMLEDEGMATQMVLSILDSHEDSFKSRVEGWMDEHGYDTAKVLAAIEADPASLGKAIGGWFEANEDAVVGSLATRVASSDKLTSFVSNFMEDNSTQAEEMINMLIDNEIIPALVMSTIEGNPDLLPQPAAEAAPTAEPLTKDEIDKEIENWALANKDALIENIVSEVLASYDLNGFITDAVKESGLIAPQAEPLTEDDIKAVIENWALANKDALIQAIVSEVSDSYDLKGFITKAVEESGLIAPQAEPLTEDDIKAIIGNWMEANKDALASALTAKVTASDELTSFVSHFMEDNSAQAEETINMLIDSEIIPALVESTIQDNPDLLPQPVAEAAPAAEPLTKDEIDKEIESWALANKDALIQAIVSEVSATYDLNGFITKAVEESGLIAPQAEPLTEDDIKAVISNWATENEEAIVDKLTAKVAASDELSSFVSNFIEDNSTEAEEMINMLIDSEIIPALVMSTIEDNPDLLPQPVAETAPAAEPLTEDDIKSIIENWALANKDALVQAIVSEVSDSYDLKGFITKAVEDSGLIAPQAEPLAEDDIKSIIGKWAAENEEAIVGKLTAKVAASDELTGFVSNFIEDNSTEAEEMINMLIDSEIIPALVMSTIEDNPDLLPQPAAETAPAAEPLTEDDIKAVIENWALANKDALVQAIVSEVSASYDLNGFITKAVENSGLITPQAEPLTEDDIKAVISNWAAENEEAIVDKLTAKVAASDELTGFVSNFMEDNSTEAEEMINMLIDSEIIPALVMSTIEDNPDLLPEPAAETAPTAEPLTEDDIKSIIENWALANKDALIENIVSEVSDSYDLNGFITKAVENSGLIAPQAEPLTEDDIKAVISNWAAENEEAIVDNLTAKVAASDELSSFVSNFIEDNSTEAEEMINMLIDSEIIPALVMSTIEDNPDLLPQPVAETAPAAEPLTEDDIKAVIENWALANKDALVQAIVSEVSDSYDLKGFIADAVKDSGLIAPQAEPLTEDDIKTIIGNWASENEEALVDKLTAKVAASDELSRFVSNFMEDNSTSAEEMINMLIDSEIIPALVMSTIQDNPDLLPEPVAEAAPAAEPLTEEDIDAAIEKWTLANKDALIQAIVSEVLASYDIDGFIADAVKESGIAANLVAEAMEANPAPRTEPLTKKDIEAVIENWMEAHKVELADSLTAKVTASDNLTAFVSNFIEDNTPQLDSFFDLLLESDIIGQLVVSTIEENPDLLPKPAEAAPAAGTDPAEIEAAIENWMKTNKDALARSLTAKVAASDELASFISSYIEDNAPQMDSFFDLLLESDIIGQLVVSTIEENPDLLPKPAEAAPAAGTDPAEIEAAIEDWASENEKAIVDKLTAKVAASDELTSFISSYIEDNAPQLDSFFDLLLESDIIPQLVVSTIEENPDLIKGLIPQQVVEKVVETAPAAQALTNEDIEAVIENWMEANKDALASSLTAKVTASDELSGFISNFIEDSVPQLDSFFDLLLESDIIPAIVASTIENNPDLLPKPAAEEPPAEEDIDAAIEKWVQANKDALVQAIVSEVLSSYDLEGFIADAVKESGITGPQAEPLTEEDIQAAIESWVQANKDALVKTIASEVSDSDELEGFIAKFIADNSPQAEDILNMLIDSDIIPAIVASVLEDNPDLVPKQIVETAPAAEVDPAEIEAALQNWLKENEKTLVDKLATKIAGSEQIASLISNYLEDNAPQTDQIINMLLDSDILPALVESVLEENADLLGPSVSDGGGSALSRNDSECGPAFSGQGEDTGVRARLVAKAGSGKDN